MFKLFRRRQRRPAASAPEPDLRGTLPDAPEWTIELIQSVRHLTMTSPERIFALCQAMEYVVRQSIPGDVVECGVWRGGSMVAAARTLIRLNATDRNLWLYDTFEGMTEPADDDVDWSGRPAGQLLQLADPADAESIWCRSPEEGVREVLTQTGYPTERLTFVRGPVEETLVRTVPQQIALLRLDTDWYESTRCELEHLFPRLAPGGVLIIDDYGHWQGCRKAVDEYLARHRIPLLLSRIDYTGRIGIKPRMGETEPNDVQDHNINAIASEIADVA